MAAVLIAVAAVAVGGCADVEPLRIEMDGVSYIIPSEHVVRAVLPGQGQPYVVARPPDGQFQLVYSASEKRRRNWQGGDTPLVFGINSHTAASFEQFDFSGGKTVCRVGPPNWTCGLRLVDGGVVWSVQFDRDQVPNSEMLRNAASSLLEQYRGQDGDRS